MPRITMALQPAAEAVIMAYHHFRGKRPKMILSPTLNPMYRETIRTYTQGYEDLKLIGDEVTGVPTGEPNPLIAQMDEQTSLVLVQYPDFFGNIYDYTELVKKAHEVGALVAISVNPIALGLLKTPVNLALILSSEKDNHLVFRYRMAVHISGFLPPRKNISAKFQGVWLVKRSIRTGKRAYVLTLTAREQHIRREKATSNICTNQGLLALAATIYMSLLGKHGLKKVAELNYQKAHYAADQIAQIPGFRICSTQPFFNEFAVCCPKPVGEI